MTEQQPRPFDIELQHLLGQREGEILQLRVLLHTANLRIADLERQQQPAPLRVVAPVNDSAGPQEIAR